AFPLLLPLLPFSPTPTATLPLLPLFFPCRGGSANGEGGGGGEREERDEGEGGAQNEGGERENRGDGARGAVRPHDELWRRSDRADWTPELARTHGSLLGRREATGQAEELWVGPPQGAPRLLRKWPVRGLSCSTITHLRDHVRRADASQALVK
ncbi:hypothetical protein B0H14DRAFT_3678044, partial [Mycena olivaceomarginata]